MKKLFFYCFCLFTVVSSLAQSNIATFPYTSIHYRGTAIMSKNEELQSCQYNVVSVIDSFLYIQLHFAGIEAGKILATPNSILFINKLQKNFYEGDYSAFKRFLDMEVDFYMLQDLFNGALDSPPEGITLSYKTEDYEYPFYKTLTCEYDIFSLQVNVKKVTFNKIPEVSTVIPGNYEVINIDEVSRSNTN
jgi:hypothetical protein